MSELLNTAVELMFLGMGTVFVFLTLLILAVKAMSYVLMKSQAEPVVEVLNPIAAMPASHALQNDERLRKVIAEAIRQHRIQH